MLPLELFDSFEHFVVFHIEELIISIAGWNDVKNQLTKSQVWKLVPELGEGQEK